MTDGTGCLYRRWKGNGIPVLLQDTVAAGAQQDQDTACSQLWLSLLPPLAQGTAAPLYLLLFHTQLSLCAHRCGWKSCSLGFPLPMASVRPSCGSLVFLQVLQNLFLFTEMVWISVVFISLSGGLLKNKRTISALWPSAPFWFQVGWHTGGWSELLRLLGYIISLLPKLIILVSDMWMADTWTGLRLTSWHKLKHPNECF